MHRRSFIRVAGGGVIAAAGASALSACAPFDVPPSATAAWNGPDPATDVRRWALSWALLAPNPHNMQPWMVDLRVPDQITLRLDPERLLPATDPYGRQILMGVGAFLELLAMAAAERGYRIDLALFPEGEPGATLDSTPVARMRLVQEANAPRDMLFAQVPQRRTDRRAYDRSRPLDPEDFAYLRRAISGHPVSFGVAGRADAQPPDRAMVEAIRAIAKRAWQIELTTEAPMMETMRVLRFGRAEIEQHRDGIAITQPMLVTLAKLGIVDRNAFPAPDSRATVAQIRDFNAVTDSTPAYLWIVTEGNTRSQQILAGRVYARLNLAGTARGLAMHPNEQALQEYPQMESCYRDIHALLGAGTPRHTVQMLARLGYLPRSAPAVPPAPRRGLDAHLIA